MQCHVIILDTTGTFYEIETEGNKEKAKTKRQIESEEEKKNKLKKQTVVPPPQEMWQTLENNELEKIEKMITRLLVNRGRRRTKGKQHAHQSTWHPPGSGSSLWYE